MQTILKTFSFTNISCINKLIKKNNFILNKYSINKLHLVYVRLAIFQHGMQYCYKQHLASSRAKHPYNQRCCGAVRVSVCSVSVLGSNSFAGRRKPFHLTVIGAFLWSSICSIEIKNCSAEPKTSMMRLRHEWCLGTNPSQICRTISNLF